MRYKLNIVIKIAKFYKNIEFIYLQIIYATI